MIITPIVADVFNEFGIRLPIGIPATVGDDYGVSLVRSLKAADANGVLPGVPNTPFDQFPAQAPVSGGGSYNQPATEAASFVITKTTHGNRVVFVNAAAGVTATLNAGHGFTDGDLVTFVQVSTGAVTLVTGSATVTLGPGRSASTDGVGSKLNCVWSADASALLVGVSPLAAQSGPVINVPDTPLATITGNTTETTVFSYAIPANTMLANTRLHLKAVLFAVVGSTAMTVNVKLAGTTLITTTFTNTFAGSIPKSLDFEIYGRASNKQVAVMPLTNQQFMTNIGISGNGGGLFYGTADMTTSQALTITVVPAQSTDSLQVVATSVQVQ